MQFLHKIVRKLRFFILIDILGIQHWMENYYQQLFYQISTDLGLPGNLMSYEDMHKSLGHCDKTSIFYKPDILTCPQKIFLFEDTNVYGCSKFIISPQGESGRFILKKHSGASQGLTVITGKHGYNVGVWSRSLVNSREKDIDKDVIVEEDVRLGANVTLLSGITIGRGSIVGACSVVTKDVPPYSIVAGNPAKVIAYKFTPEQVQKHEELLYPVEERIDLNIVRSHYDDFYHHSQL